MLTTLILVASVLSLWLLWRKKKISVFKNLEIPGPEPNIVFGNYWEMVHEGQEKCINRWIKQYGTVFGYYHGLRPIVVVAEPDLIRTVLQKEFQKFSSRPPIFAIGSSTKSFNNHAITTASGKKWKDLRSILTPTFTVAKLKTMSPIMNDAIEELVECVENEASKGKPFDIYRMYQNLTMDVIARTSLGVHTNAQKDKNESFVKLARAIVSVNIGYFTMFAYSFPEFINVFSGIRTMIMSMYNYGRHPREELEEKTHHAIQARRNNPNSRRKDVLQLLLDAKQTQEVVKESSLAAGENEDQVPTGTAKQESSKKGAGLTDEEILQNSTAFLLAGYETTSTALAFTTHLLTYHQDIQDKVREEIRSVLESEKELTYEAVNKMQYLDQVFNESLRVFPPITYFVNRSAVEDTTIGSFKVPTGIAIQIPVYYLHHEPEFWDKPEEFNPERFTPEEKARRHPMVFQPFGAGPRNCVGMRFAQMEAKMAIAKLLNKYKFLPKQGTTEGDFKYGFSTVILRPTNGVVLQIEKV